MNLIETVINYHKLIQSDFGLILQDSQQKKTFSAWRWLLIFTHYIFSEYIYCIFTHSTVAFVGHETHLQQIKINQYKNQ